jgi:hypothetical protein
LVIISRLLASILASRGSTVGSIFVMCRYNYPLKSPTQLVDQSSPLLTSVVARIVWRLYKTGIGLTAGFIGSHTVTHNYSVYTLRAPHSSLQRLPSLHTVSSLVACLPISQDPFLCNSSLKTAARPEYSFVTVLNSELYS